MLLLRGNCGPEGGCWDFHNARRSSRKISGNPCVILNINEGIEIKNIFESNFCLIISSNSGMLYKAIRHLIDDEVLMPKTGYMTTSLCCAPPLLLLWPCIQLESSQHLPASPGSPSMPAFLCQLWWSSIRSVLPNTGHQLVKHSWEKVQTAR